MEEPQHGVESRSQPHEHTEYIDECNKKWQGTRQPTHYNWIINSPLITQQGSKTFIKICYLMNQSTGRWHNHRSKWSMLNFLNPLSICSPLCVFMLLIASWKGTGCLDEANGLKTQTSTNARSDLPPRIHS